VAGVGFRSDLLQWRFASAHSSDGDPVFPNFAGRHWTEPDTRAWAGRRFRPALRAAGIGEAVRPYDLRHSAASMWIAWGLNVVEVARRMGHSPTMCLSTYAHVFEQWEGKGPIDLEEEVRLTRSVAERRASYGA
jgi:integrase